MSLDIPRIKAAADKILTLDEDVATALETLKKLGANTKDDAIRKAFGDLTEAREKMDEAYGELAILCGQPPPTSFASFLSDVGEAAVATQQKLDVENFRSAQQALAAGHAPSGVFRLPSVKGEVKFGFSALSNRKLGLLFYSRKTSEETRNEQSLQFEITSTPPPPELLQSAARRLDLALLPELEPARRAEVLKVFLNPKHILGKERRPVPNYDEHLALDATERDRLVILPADRFGDPATGRHFVFHAADSAATPSDKLGIWLVDIPARELHVVWKVASNGLVTENIDVFRQWILDIGIRQNPPA